MMSLARHLVESDYSGRLRVLAPPAGVMCSECVIHNLNHLPSRFCFSSSSVTAASIIDCGTNRIVVIGLVVSNPPTRLSCGLLVTRESVQRAHLPTLVDTRLPGLSL